MNERELRRLTTKERLALKWLDLEWRPAGKIVGPSDYICRKLVLKGLVVRRYFLRPEYRLSSSGVNAKESIS